MLGFSYFQIRWHRLREQSLRDDFDEIWSLANHAVSLPHFFFFMGNNYERHSNLSDKPCIIIPILRHRLDHFSS